MTETAELPLKETSRAPRSVLSLPQALKASDWMRANADEVRASTNPTLAAKLTVVLGAKVTENNVISLRDATGLHPHTPETQLEIKLKALATAVRLLVLNEAEQTVGASARAELGDIAGALTAMFGLSLIEVEA